MFTNRFVLAFLFTPLTLVPPAPVWAADGKPNDPVAERLEIARDAYKKAAEEVKVAVETFMEKQIVVATNSGQREKAESLQSELRLFKEESLVPISAPVAIHRKQAGAIKRFAEAAEIAVKRYTRDGNFEASSQAEKEAEQLKQVVLRSEVRHQLIGTWRLTLAGYKSLFIFRPDGTMLHTTENATLDWHVDWDAGVVDCKGSNMRERIQLPLNPRGTKGFNKQGNEFKIVKQR